MDKLKYYILENRKAFDNQQPSDGLWAKIEGDLNQKPLGRSLNFQPKRWLNLRVAASVILLLGIGYTAGRYLGPISENSDIMSLSPKYGTEVVQYTSFIESKKKMLHALGKTDPILLKNFSEDLENLNLNYEKLRESLPKNPNQEEILNRMIDNLQWQMQLLDAQLDIIKERNKEKVEEFVKIEDPQSEDDPARWA